MGVDIGAAFRERCGVQKGGKRIDARFRQGVLQTIVMRQKLD
jgi:hypothetical protein